MGREDQHGGIYRPPKVAFMPYTEATSTDKKRRDRLPAALNNLAFVDPNNPHIESTSGLGGGGPRGSGLVSARARELARMTEFEEENMTRLVMNKKEAKRRKMDEATIALGGSASMAHGDRSRTRGGGLADEFGDLVRMRDRPSRFAGADGYEELRVRAKKKDAFERSKVRRKEDAEDAVELGERPTKRTRFEHEVPKKQQKRRRR
jgi:U3 small nucleolar ribonucleoprotein protein LCP5